MGPIIPDIFSEEFGLLLAVILGIGFGFVLEQAGFSSTKKLVGLFYGYDFTVLRVFFTAGVTAMIGVVLLSDYGLLDMNLVYINPTFLRSALVGGGIMGAGFIIGGFCPGTSICAASIGKLDAMAFVVGSLLGVFLFTELFPTFEKFYMADAQGPVTMYGKLGISKMLFAVGLTVVALAAFYITWRIENRVNNRPNTLHPVLRKQYIVAMAAPLVILAVLLILPDKETIIQNKIAKAKEQKKCVFHEITADKLAFEITNNYYQMNIIDVRTPEEFKAYHLPLAINIPFDEIANREWETYFKQNLKTNIFCADADTLVKMACLRAKYIGKSENKILHETVDEFRTLFFKIDSLGADATKHEVEVYHFRVDAAKNMMNLENSLKNIDKPVKKVASKVQGGCS